MNNKKEQPIDVLQLFEQMEANMRNCAPLFVSYYNKLREEKCPDLLAMDLTIELHRIFWENSLSALKK